MHVGVKHSQAIFKICMYVCTYLYFRERKEILEVNTKIQDEMKTKLNGRNVGKYK